MLVVFKSAPILKRTLKVKHATLQVKNLTRFEEQIKFESFTGMIKLFVEQKSNRSGVIAKRGTEKVMENKRVVKERQM